MKKNANNTVRFTIDFIGGQIIGTKASFDKASKGCGPIYEELAEKVAHHPNFKLVVKEQKKHNSKPKRTYDGLTFEFMEKYIAIQDDAKRAMREYEATKNTSKNMNAGAYPSVKKWFLKKYEGFDMKTARNEICEAKRKEAGECLSAEQENGAISLSEKVVA